METTEQNELEKISETSRDGKKLFGKSPQALLSAVNILYNKKKITWSLGDTKIIFLKIFHSFAALLTHEAVNFVSLRCHAI